MGFYSYCAVAFAEQTGFYGCSKLKIKFKLHYVVHPMHDELNTICRYAACFAVMHECASFTLNFFFILGTRLKTCCLSKGARTITAPKSLLLISRYHKKNVSGLMAACAPVAGLDRTVARHFRMSATTSTAASRALA